MFLRVKARGGVGHSRNEPNLPSEWKLLLSGGGGGRQNVLLARPEICSIPIPTGYQILKLDTGHHKLSIYWDTTQMSVLHA